MSEPESGKPHVPDHPPIKPDLGLYQCKYWLRGILRHIPGLAHLNPNVLSLLAFVPGLLAAWFLFSAQWGWAMAAIVARMVLNTLDGLVAEEFGKQSHLGGYLNRVPGEFTDLLIVVGLFPHGPFPGGFFLIVLVGWVQIFGMLGVLAGGSTQSVGPCGQTDRLVIILVGSLLCLLGLESMAVWGWIINLMVAGCILTIGLRIYRSVHELEDLDEPPLEDEAEETAPGDGGLPPA